MIDIVPMFLGHAAVDKAPQSTPPMALLCFNDHRERLMGFGS
jgi:hypothetical protein